MRKKELLAELEWLRTQYEKDWEQRKATGRLLIRAVERLNEKDRVIKNLLAKLDAIYDIAEDLSMPGPPGNEEDE